jgi:hypothetical protein
MRVARLRKAYVATEEDGCASPRAVGRAVVCEGGLARSAWNGWSSATFRSRVIFAIQRVRSAILAL